MTGTDLELLVLNTRLIFTNTLSHQDAILFGEALGTHWAVGEPVEDEHSPYNSGAA